MGMKVFTRTLTRYVNGKKKTLPLLVPDKLTKKKKTYPYPLLSNTIRVGEMDKMVPLTPQP